VVSFDTRQAGCFGHGEKGDLSHYKILFFERENRYPKEFFRRFDTVDETWIHHHTPETKEQPK